ncbi:DUF4190 domain-containing protein [Streptomyces sp. NPDC052042]|uniref:DUF4190 domain-containing protein n=1 Tax=Streptomyces sp. NPDC052042 TaxID=3365683 RepID=UPI0037D9672B
MSDNTQQPAEGAAPRDPWAPPDNKVSLDKPTGEPRPPAVHDQPTLASMPGAADGPAPAPGPGAGFGAVPPPPIAPNGPGPQMPPAPVAGQYGYPAAPAPPYGYPGYGGYPQAPWGGPPPVNGMGTAAMVLGILSLCLFCLYGVPSIVLGVLALIFGILGRKRARRGEADNGGQALAGIITGSVGIALGTAVIAFFVWVVTVYPEEFEEEGSHQDPFATSLIVDIAR